MSKAAHRLRRTLVAVAKITLAAAILGYLVWQVEHNDGFVRLVEQPKNWWMLAAGLGCTITAVTLSFVRWHTLVRALGLEFPLLETMRLGALGFALNFVSLGSVGGDLFKAFFLAKRFPGRRTEAVATVMADRIMGLLLMLGLASAAILVTDWSSAPTTIVLLCRTILLATAIAATGVILVLFVPALSGESVRGVLERIPIAGPTAARLIGAVSAYRNEKSQLLLAAAVSLVVDAMFILSFYLVARGLPMKPPTLVQHSVIVPVASLAGAIPATPSGLGTMEAAVEALYQAIGKPTGSLPGDGTLVALGQRMTMILVALGCLTFYVLQRADVREMMHDVEEAADGAESFEAGA